MPRLENWSLTTGDPSPYRPPDAGPQMLHGTVYGHPRFDDGDPVTTSPIVAARAAGHLRAQGFDVRQAGGAIEVSLDEPEPGDDAA